jgi:glycosyltransferase involved in cell wall biosynthesis
MVKLNKNMLVSILIPCYNAERWLGETIQSALDQSWPSKEIIVVDDGSTDNSLAVLRRFNGQIRWETGPNRGANAARNRLLQLARGEWVQYLDADDYLFPEKIERQIGVARSRPAVDFVIGSVGREYWSPNEVRREFQPAPEPLDPWMLVIRPRGVETSGALWRRAKLEEIGGWNEDQPCCQEHELYLRLLMAGASFAFSPDVGAIYRLWSEETVYNRNKRERYLRTLEIYDRAENFLLAGGQLTSERLRALSQARFEVARLVWLYDRELAIAVIAKVNRSDPGFVPAGAAGRLHYRIAYRLFGFDASEKLAGLKRSALAGGKVASRP